MATATLQIFSPSGSLKYAGKTFTPTGVFELAGFIDVITRIVTSVVFPTRMTDFYFELTPTLSQTEYEHAIRMFAPNRNVSEVDAELTELFSTHHNSSTRNFDINSLRLLRQTASFRAVVSAYNAQASSNQANNQGDQITASETVAISEVGLRITHALENYSTELVLGPRDLRRVKLMYLLLWTFLGPESQTSTSETEQPTPFGMACDALARISLADDDTDSWLPTEAEMLAAELDGIAIEDGDDDSDTTDNSASTNDSDNTGNTDSSDDEFSLIDTDIGFTDISTNMPGM